MALSQRRPNRQVRPLPRGGIQRGAMVAGGDRPSPTEAAAETLSPFEEMVLRRKRSKEWRKAYHPQSGKILSFRYSELLMATPPVMAQP